MAILEPSKSVVDKDHYDDMFSARDNLNSKPRMTVIFTPVSNSFMKDYQNVPSARFTLHSTKLCIKFKILRKKIFFGTKVTSEAFLSISQNLKVTRLQGGTQTKL